MKEMNSVSHSELACGERKNRFQIWAFYIAEVCSNPKIVFHFELPKKKKKTMVSYLWSKLHGHGF